LARGMVIAAPRSGSGKTLVTLAVIAALRGRGFAVAAAKAGPDYLDTAILSRVAGRPAVNLDPWAMSPARLAALATAEARDADLLAVEGVMGLFDGAADGRGSTGDLAAILDLPVVLVVDGRHQSQSVGPLVAGFANWRRDVKIAGVIVNRVGSMRHQRLLVGALRDAGLNVLGAVPERDDLVLPGRHLGLVLPDEFAAFDRVVDMARVMVADYVDLAALMTLGRELPVAARTLPPAPRLPPLGQRIAIARDAAFAFVYAHWLADWRTAGATLSFFSPLADEAPAPDADAVFLPGGYPELHCPRLAEARRFKAGVAAAAARGSLVYGECGGFMVLGRTITDKDDKAHAMAGLLPVETAIAEPRRVLGYRRLAHGSPLPWPAGLNGHEFHYSHGRVRGTPTLFEATDAVGTALPAMGACVGRVMGSYAHVIDVA
jgi:cobyrinic acid a,c-diamide synthase